MTRTQMRPGVTIKKIGNITGEALLRARTLAGMTQPELGAAVGRSERTISNWEADGVARGAEGLVEAVLGDYLERDQAAARRPLAALSDDELILKVTELVLELGSRLRDSRTQVYKVSETTDSASAEGHSEDPPSSNLRYGNTGRPGRRRSQAQE